MTDNVIGIEKISGADFEKLELNAADAAFNQNVDKLEEMLDGKAASEHVHSAQDVGAYTKSESDKKTNAVQESVNAHSAEATRHLTNEERNTWSTVTNKVDKVSGKQLSTEDYTSAEKAKLAGIDAGANKYTLPVAGAALGGVKSGTDISVDATGNVSVVDDSHNHVIGNVDELQGMLAGKAAEGHKHVKADVTDFPDTMPPTAHKATHKTGGSDALTAADVGAAATTHSHKAYVPVERKVNGKSLNGDISLAAADVGAVTAADTVKFVRNPARGGGDFYAPDFNGLIENGFYRISANATATNQPPTSMDGFLQVMHYEGTIRVAQIYIDDNNKMYSRAWVSGRNWTPWMRKATTDMDVGLAAPRFVVNAADGSVVFKGNVLYRMHLDKYDHFFIHEYAKLDGTPTACVLRMVRGVHATENGTFIGTSHVNSMHIAQSGVVRFPINYEQHTTAPPNIYFSSGAMLMRCTSSKRYKEHVGDVDVAQTADCLRRLKVVNFKSKCESDDQEIVRTGGYAEEFRDVDARLAIFEVDDDGNRVFEESGEAVVAGIDTNEVLYRLLAGWQYLDQKVQELQAKADKSDQVIDLLLKKGVLTCDDVKELAQSSK